jgi:hypothetical protein
LVELILDETTPDLSSLNSHIVATTFERYLKGTMLKVGVEDFFLEWPTLSEVEIEELTAYFAEEEAPADDDDDLDDLPLDNVPVRKKKKKVVAAGKKSVKKKPRELLLKQVSSN